MLRQTNDDTVAGEERVSMMMMMMMSWGFVNVGECVDVTMAENIRQENQN